MKSLACAVMIFLAACGDDKDGVGAGQLPEIQVREGQRPINAGTRLAVRPELPATLSVVNIGSAVLRIEGLVLESDPAGALVLVSDPMPSAAAPGRRPIW